jgi:hypothetical protein
MTRNELLLAIEQHVRSLDEQQRRLQTFAGRIPAIESDLLLRQVRQLYELALQLEQNAPHEPAAPSAPAPAAAEPPSPASVSEEHASTSEKILIEAAQQQEPPAAVPQAGIPGKKIKGDVNSVLYREGPTVGGRFEDEPTIHGRIATAHAAGTIASRQQHKAVSDLRQAIGINEKFLFINQLFDGNLPVYNQAIDYLNQCAGKAAAMEYVHQTLAAQFGWDMQGNVCRMFMEWIDRRHPEGQA